jgi:hypothetical protein
MIERNALDKFTRGQYALCSTCGNRPCLDGCPGPSSAEPEQEIATLTKPKSGKAPPFWLWDRIIPDYGLSFRDQAVLVYLCRRTFGYGKYHGDYISWGEIAHGCSCDRKSAKRAVLSLLDLGLVVHKPQGFAENGAPNKAFIGVILPGYWPAES